MSHFMVVSVCDRTNWIAEEIVKCTPKSQEALSLVSAGKIEKIEGDYFYYTHSLGSVKSEQDKKKATSFKVCFANQLAQFRKITGVSELVNVLLLDNPMTEEQQNLSDSLIEEIEFVYEELSTDRNFQVFRVLFSYDLENPTDIAIQVNKEYLKRVFDKYTSENKPNFMPKLLYLDNQNQKYAALCTSKESHDLMVPRMLCDFMLLYSSLDVACVNAINLNSNTFVFSIGYAECMYYHEDIKRFWNLVDEQDLYAYQLECKNDVLSLDIDKCPIGLKCRRDGLAQRHEKVPFYEDVKLFDSSIDKEIDDIVVSLKEYLIACKKEALEEALSNEKKEFISTDLEEIEDACEGERIASFVEKVKSEYPDYIDRREIYDKWMTRKDDDENPDRCDFFNNDVFLYKKILRFIAYDYRFKKYLEGVDEKKLIQKGKAEQEKMLEIEREKNKCRFFFWKTKAGKGKEKNEVKETEFEPMSNVQKKLKKLLEEKENFEKLQNKIKDLEGKVRKIQRQIDDFSLTWHCASYDTLVDVEALKKYRMDNKIEFVSEICDEWSDIAESERKEAALYELRVEKTRLKIKKFEFVDWEKPFPFVKKIDLKQVVEKLQAHSTPIVNTARTVTDMALDYTTQILYLSDEKLKKELDGFGVNSVCSDKIESKICVFSFLRLEIDYIKGLADLS